MISIVTVFVLVFEFISLFFAYLFKMERILFLIAGDRNQTAKKGNVNLDSITFQ